MSALVLTVRFLCELAAVAALAWWGWPAAGIAGGAAVVVLWGAFVAPRARRRLPDPGRLALELAIFGGATAGFAAVAGPVAAAVFGVAAVVTALGSRRLEHPS